MDVSIFCTKINLFLIVFLSFWKYPRTVSAP